MGIPISNEQKEVFKKLANETFKECVMENVDSTLIFTYIKNLEEENKKMQSDWNELKNYVIELHTSGEHITYSILKKMSNLKYGYNQEGDSDGR